MNQLLDDQEGWALWYDGVDSSTDEHDGDFVTKNWGVRECLIVAIFVLMFFIIFRKGNTDPDEADGSSSQSIETVVSTVDKKQSEEEKREIILNFFQSKKTQQVCVGLIRSF